MKLYHELKPIKIPLLFVIFLLSFFVIHSTFINSYAAPGGKMNLIPKKIGPDLVPKPPSIVKYPNHEIKEKIEKKLEIKLNKLTPNQELKINSLYNTNRENFQSIVNYVRAFANFVIVIPQMLNYR